MYGFYFALFNFTFLFNMVLDMGITNFNNRNIAQDNQLLSQQISGILTLKLCLGTLYLFITFIAGLLIGYTGMQLKLLAWMALNQFLNAFILYLRSNISALLMFKTDSVLSVLDRLLMIIFCGFLLWGRGSDTPFKIEWFIWSQTAAYFITVLTALFIVFHKAGKIVLVWEFSFYRSILEKSFPFAILYLLMSFYNRIDSVMIERILPNDIASFETGVYASVFRLLDAFVMISYLFSVILLPLFSKMLHNKEDIHPIAKSSFQLLFYFSVTVVVISIFYDTQILDLLYKNNISQSAEVLVLLIPGLIPISFTYLFGTLLTANGNMRMLNITSLIGIGVNIIVNFILIPQMHARGAAIASLSTQSVVSLLQILIAFRELKLPISVLSLKNISFYLLLFIPITFILVHVLHQNILVNLLIIGLSSLLIAFLTKLIPISFFASMIKEKKNNIELK